MEETVTISLAEYERLKKDSEWLDWLYAAGVYNWEGWETAVKISQEDNE